MKLKLQQNHHMHHHHHPLHLFMQKLELQEKT
jgi:hypothetical protein